MMPSFHMPLRGKGILKSLPPKEKMGGPERFSRPPFIDSPGICDYFFLGAGLAALGASLISTAEAFMV